MKRKLISWDFIAGLSLALLFPHCNRTPAADMPKEKFRSDYRNVILRIDSAPKTPTEETPLPKVNQYGIVWA